MFIFNKIQLHPQIALVLPLHFYFLLAYAKPTFPVLPSLSSSPFFSARLGHHVGRENEIKAFRPKKKK